MLNDDIVNKLLTTPTHVFLACADTTVRKLELANKGKTRYRLTNQIYHHL